MTNQSSSVASFLNSHPHWRPILLQGEQPSPQCLARTKRDIKEFNAQPPPGIFIAPEEDDVTKLNALLVGSFDTPYEGGLFHFILKCPADYPLSPPRVRFLTTDGGRVAFNPHFFADGRICLSILNYAAHSWEGSVRWSAVQGLSSLLVSIQSLFNQYHARTGTKLEQEEATQERRNKDAVLQHETIRVAVCGVIEDCLNSASLLPPALRDVALTTFLDFYETYENFAKSLLHLSGSSMAPTSLAGGTVGVFHFDRLLTQLQSLKGRLKEQQQAAHGQQNQ